jgi:glycosyltransferase involved in cell wall biosynthesis
VIKAAKLLKDNGRFRFVFVGEGPVKSKLEKMTADLLLPNVDFLPQVPIKEIAAYINASDVSLVPLKKNPIFNGFIPSKMFDLMCCGKPVILSVPGEARQILEESGGGVYVEPDNAEALAEALVELSKNPASLAEMGRSGRNYVLRHFLRDEQVDKLEKLFARLISD